MSNVKYCRGSHLLSVDCTAQHGQHSYHHLGTPRNAESWAPPHLPEPKSAV